MHYEMDDWAAGGHPQTVDAMPSLMQEEVRQRSSRNNGWKNRKHNTYSLDEKPWRRAGADITDYFNYGFTEETWKSYSQKQKKMQRERRHMTQVVSRKPAKQSNGNEHNTRPNELGAWVDRRPRHQKEESRPCSASDSRRLFPRWRDPRARRWRDFWPRNRKDAGSSSGGSGRASSSAAADGATRLLTSSDFTCPSDPGFQGSSAPRLVRRGSRVESRDRHRNRNEARDEGQEDERPRNKERDKRRGRKRGKGKRRQGGKKSRKRRRERRRENDRKAEEMPHAQERDAKQTSRY